METLESFVRRNARIAAEQRDTAADSLIYRLGRGHRITGEPLHAATYTQALHTWWHLVLAQADKRNLDFAVALNRVRGWAADYLTDEPGATKPGSLFDHAIAHSSRLAARRFLAATDATSIAESTGTGEAAQS